MSARADQDNELRGSARVHKRLRRRGSLSGSMTHKADIDPAREDKEPASFDDCIVVRRRAGPQNQRMQDEDKDKEDQLRGEDARLTCTQQTDSEDSDIVSLAGPRHQQRRGGHAAEDDDREFDVNSDGLSTTNITKGTNTRKVWHRMKAPAEVFVPWAVQHQDILEIRRKQRTKPGTTQASARDDDSNSRDPFVSHNNQQQLRDEMEIDTMSSLPEPSAGSSGTAPSRPELALRPPPASSSLSAAHASSPNRHKARRSPTSALHSSGDSPPKAAASRLRIRRLGRKPETEGKRDLGITPPTDSMANDSPTSPRARVLTSSDSESDVPLAQLCKQRRDTIARATDANQPGSEPYSVAGEHATDHPTAAARIKKLEEEVATLKQTVERCQEQTVTVAGSTRVSSDASEQVSVVSPEEGATHNPLQAGETDPWSSPPQSSAQSREVIVNDEPDELPSAVPRSQVGDPSPGQSTVSANLAHSYRPFRPAVQTSDTLSTSTISMPRPDTRVPTSNPSHDFVTLDLSSFEIPAATLQMSQPQIPDSRPYADPIQPEQPRMAHAAQQTFNAYTGITSSRGTIGYHPQATSQQPYSMMSHSNPRHGPSPASGDSPTHTVNNFVIVDGSGPFNPRQAAGYQVTPGQFHNYLNSMSGPQSLAGFPQNYYGVANAPAQLLNSYAQPPGTAGNSVAGRSMWRGNANPVPAFGLGPYLAGPLPQDAPQFASVPPIYGRGPGSAFGFTGSPSVGPPGQNTGHFVATNNRRASISRPTLPSVNQTPQGSQGSIWGQLPPSQNTWPPGSGPWY